MKVINVLRKECILAGADLTDKAEALQKIVETAKNSPVLNNVSCNEILEGLQEREVLGSTGFGNHIAIPHCRLKNIDDFVVGIITVPNGVNFESLDGKKVKLIIFIIAPEAESNKHIKLLSNVSQTLHKTGVVDELTAGPTPESIMESFVRNSRGEIEPTDRKNKNIFRIFVQDENVLKDLVAILTETDFSSVVIIDAENASAYLSKMPIFASFWTDQPSGYCKIIVAIVEKELTNETIRRIESITGNLDECTGVLVTVEEIKYCAGALSIQ